MHMLPCYKQLSRSLSSALWGMTTKPLPEALRMLRVPDPTSFLHFTSFHRTVSSLLSKQAKDSLINPT
jgi:hypothetical protein